MRFVILSWLAVSAVLTAHRARVWGDGEAALWLDAVLAAPAKVRPLVNLAGVEYRAGRSLEARQCLLSALRASRDASRPLAERREGEAITRANLILLDLQDCAEESCRDRAREDYALFRRDFPVFASAQQLEEALWPR